MRKQIYQWWAKALAALLTVCSLTAAITLTLATALVWIAESEGGVKELLRSRMAENYGARLLSDAVESDFDPEILKELDGGNLNYTVVQLATDKEGNLTGKRKVLYSNCGEAVNAQNYNYYMEGGENYFYYDTSSALGMVTTYAYGLDDGEGVLEYEPVALQNFCFDLQKGKLYAHTLDHYYLVRDMSVVREYPVKDYPTEEDLIRTGIISAAYTYENLELLNSDSDTDAIWRITWSYRWDDELEKYWNVFSVEGEEEYLKLKDCRKWAGIEVAGGMISTEMPGYGKLVYVTGKDITENQVITTDSFYIEYPYVYEAVEREAQNYYAVYMSVKDSIAYDIQTEGGIRDYFGDVEQWCYKLYTLNDWGGVFTVIAWMLSLLFLVLFTCQLGHRPKEEGIVTRRWDKVPFGILVTLIVSGVVVGMLCNAGILEGLTWLPVGAYLALNLVCCGMWLFLILALYATVIVRMKSGTFWHTTLLYYILKPVRCLLGRIGRLVREQFSFIWKVFLLIGGITLLQFFVIGGTGYSPDVEMTLFFLYKLVEIPVVILVCLQLNRLKEGGERIASGNYQEPIDTKGMFWEFKKHADNINHVGDGISLAVEERMKSERFRTELITNVSHDIKTPLTSIINYVDLMKKEDITDPTLVEYMEVLDRQSSRLKKLIEDLMEASKASTGNLPVNAEVCDATVMLSQVVGEFEERAKENGLELIVESPKPPVEILADGRHLWRIIDNLMVNACKYAMPGTRVYIDLERFNGMVIMTFRNISKNRLNVSSEELMERFVRGDSSRNTEGSGLGLSIAQSLALLMDGNMAIQVDGDLFKAIVSFPEYHK